MKIRIATKTRILAALGLSGALLTAGCPASCEEQAEQLCESCDDKGQTAYECNYSVIEQTYANNGVAQFWPRAFRYTGCFDDLAAMEAECQGFCDGFYECDSVEVDVFDCEGGHCSGDDEAGGMGAAACDPNWFLASDVVQDPASGTIQVATAQWHHLLSDPGVLACDGSYTAPDVTGAGFVLHGVAPGSLTAALGLSDGDLFVSANGMPLTTAAEVDAAYWALRDQTNLELVVQRRGGNVTLHYVPM